MGKKGSWFSALKKALKTDSKEKKDPKSKKKWFANDKSANDLIFLSEQIPPDDTPGPLPTPEPENEQTNHSSSEAALSATQAASEFIRLTSIPHYSGKSRDELATIIIQTAFRGYMARRALRALIGLVRLKSLMQRHSVKRQVSTTLRCMQTLVRVQSQVRARRIRMSEENQALHRQLEQNRDEEFQKSRAAVAGDWDLSTKSKAQIEAKMAKKKEAAKRRERAMAYAFSHQQSWKGSSKSSNPTFMDTNNPHWGWSWLERWMADRPWETESIIDYYDRMSVKSAVSHVVSVKSNTRTNTTTPPSSGLKSGRPNVKPLSLTVPRGEDDSRTLQSVKSDRYRRRSIGGSSVKDDNLSLASSSTGPKYTGPTKPARRAQLPSPKRKENNVKVEKGLMGSAGSAKKRLTFAAAPGLSRRHSGPPNMHTWIEN